MSFVDRIARIRVELEGIKPTIWRRVEVPLTTSLKGLHEVIQAVMLFENYHLFRKRCELARLRSTYDRDLKRVGIQYWRISSTTAGMSW